MEYDLHPMEARCPICYGIKAARLWSITSDQAAQHFVLREVDEPRHIALVECIERLWTGSGDSKRKCDVVECQSCKFCFSFPYVAGNKEFYGLAFDGHGYPQRKWEFEETLKIIRRMDSSNLKLIEVGAGDGAFVRTISRSVVRKENVLATEFSRYGYETIRDSKIPCYHGDMRELPHSKYEGYFNVACAFQVLEHTDRLEQFFESIHSLLAPGGSLFVAVPNAARICFNEKNGALLDMPPNHIGRWNKKCFELVAQRFGFELVDHKTERSSATSMARQILVYRFLRKSQESDSLANRMRRYHGSIFGRGLQAIGVMSGIVTALPALRNWHNGLGNSQWAQLKKVS